MLNKTALVRRATETVSETGVVERTWSTTVYEALPICFQPMTQEMAQKSFGRINVGQWFGAVAFTAELVEGDLLTIDGADYELMTPPVNASGRDHHWELACNPFEPPAGAPAPDDGS